jgi:hypothetical protein
MAVMTRIDAQSAAKRPDFFCIGMQKAGTTWLHENLKPSEGFFSSLIKEPHYFDNKWVWPQFSKVGSVFFLEHSRMEIQRQLLESIDWSFRDLRRYLEDDPEATHFQLAWITALINARSDILTEKWYERQFALCPEDRKTGDFTPDYYLLPEDGVRELFRQYANAKFIILLRDPVERDWSALRMQCASDDVDQLLRRYDSPEYVIRSEYREILRRWNKVVPPDQFGTFFFDEISRSPVDLLDRVSGFLEIAAPIAGWVHATSKVHQGRSAVPPPRVLEAMISRNRESLSFLADEFGSYAVEWKARYL